MQRERRLLRHGFALFLLALLTGLVAYGLANPRMGVAAHVEGVVNAIFLMVLGVAWPRLDLRGRAAPWAEGLLRVSPVGGVLAPLLCSVLVLWGLRRRVAA